ncbi:hypothetical protein A4A49_06995 [Nicotiana attenuata]|uniref:Uncharacterized protein n=1 Tax=Nicotiana attenuata TaxID=49451 RepID=A0A1J6INW4_NICAT|nr:hypothetical protein A4A49_06995 [Nicotiana attenuata]
MLLSQLFYKDNSKIIFKVFGHKVVFTDEDFHTITGLKVEAADYSFIDVRENRLTEWYFSEVNRGLKVENLFHFTEKRSRLSDGTTVKVSIDVEACDEVVVKLAQIYLLEAILLGKFEGRNMSDRSMNIIDNEEKFKVLKVNPSYLLEHSSKIDVSEIVNMVPVKVQDIIRSDQLDKVVEFIGNLNERSKKKYHHGFLNDEDGYRDFYKNGDERNEFRNGSSFSMEKYDKRNEHGNSKRNEARDPVDGDNDPDRDFDQNNQMNKDIDVPICGYSAHCSGNEQGEDVDLDKQDEYGNMEFKHIASSSLVQSVMDIESVHGGQNKEEGTDEGAAAGGDLVEGPSCDEERADCTLVEPTLTDGQKCLKVFPETNEICLPAEIVQNEPKESKPTHKGVKS